MVGRLIPAGFTQFAQQSCKNVDIAKSISKSGTRIAKEYAFKEGHPLLKHGIGYIRTCVDEGHKGVRFMEAFDTNGRYLTSKVKELIAFVKSGGHGIKVEGMNDPNFLRNVWKR